MNTLARLSARQWGCLLLLLLALAAPLFLTILFRLWEWAAISFQAAVSAFHHA